MLNIHIRKNLIMSHYTTKLIPVVFLCLCATCCVKDKRTISNAVGHTAIDSAQLYFESSVLGEGGPPNSQNYRAHQPRTVRWDLSRTVLLSNGQAIVAPVQFTHPLFITSDVTGNGSFSLNDITALIVMRDSSAQFHCSLVTYLPDSTAIVGVSTSSGIMLVEDWQGNSIRAPRRFVKQLNSISTSSTDGNDGNVETDVDVNIEVCNTIYGYNYSSDFPDDGESWSETSCNTYGLQQLGSDGSPGPRDLTGIFVRRIPIYTVQLAPPGNPIGNIADYFKCFTQSDNSDHQYTVTLAVEQPVTDSRQPWTWSSTGLGGSSAGTNPINVGHTWLIFSESTGIATTTRNVGFYPQSIVLPGSATAQGVLANDENMGYDISLTINVSSQQFFDMLNYTSQGNNAGYDYNLNSNNCTTFALDAMAAGGVAIPATIGTWTGGGQGLDPGDLGEDLRGMQLAGNMSQNTVSNPHPNVGTCN